MTAVSSAGTNGLLSQVTLRTDSITGDANTEVSIGCGPLLSEATDTNCSGGSHWKDFYDDLSEQTQEP